MEYPELSSKFLLPRLMKPLTWGSTPKRRVRSLLEALLSYGEWQRDFDISGHKSNWRDESSNSPRLIVETKVRHLLELLRKQGCQEILKLQDPKEYVRGMLKRLEELAILTIISSSQGSEDWQFTLTLWSKDKTKNLDKFDSEWETRRPEKSKAHETALTNIMQMPVAPLSKLSATTAAPSTLPALINHVPSDESHFFVGRKQLIQELMAAVDTTHMIAILGIPGVGKTALMKQIASCLDRSRVFWYEFRPGLVSLDDVLGGLARFLDSQPESEGNLVGALRAPIFSASDRIALVIEGLNIACYYLFFDSVHHIEKDSPLDSFFVLLKQQLRRGTTFVAGRSKPCFYTPIDEARQVVKPVELDGLREFKEVQQFFAHEGISLTLEVAKAINKRFGGLPLALKLIAVLLGEDFTETELLALAAKAEEKTINYLFEEVYERLNRAERDLLTTASLYIFPFSPERLMSAYRAIFEQDSGQIYFAKLKRQLLIRQFASNSYQVHEVIRTLTLTYADEPSKYRVQLADHLVSEAPDDDRVELEAALLYYDAKAFNQSAELVVRIIELGFLPYHPNQADILLNRFEERMVGAKQWMWLVGSQGYLAHFWRRDDKAEERYQTMLRLAWELQDKTAAALAFQRLGNIYLERDDEIAKRYYLDSLALKKELDDLEGQAEIYSNLGSLYTEQHQFPEAHSALEKGLDLLASIEAPEWQKLLLYCNLGNLYAEQGQWEAAVRFTKSACQIAQEMNMPYEVASSTYDLGLHEAKQGNQEAALEHYLNALEITKAYGFWQIEESVQVALGKQYHELGDYDEAIACFQRVVEIEEEVEDKTKLASSYFDIGSFYYHKNDYQRALGCYEKGIALFEHLTDEKQVRLFLSNIYVLANQSAAPQKILPALKLLKNRLLVNSPSYALAKVYGTLGNIYLKLLHRNRIALACIRQEITLLAQLNHRREQVEALTNLGVIYESLERYGDMLDTDTEAIRIAQIHNLYSLASVAHYNRANCFTKLKLWQQAEDDYRCSLTVAQEVGNTQLQESVLHNFGEMYRRCGRLEDAVNLLNLSLESSRQRGDIEGEITTLNNLGLAYQALSQDQVALTCFNSALDLSRQQYRKRQESRILISLGNFYQVDELPDRAKGYYENALAAARVAEDTGLEEDSILSLAYTHKQLGTFDNIATDFKIVAERSIALEHYENSVKFLALCGEINLEEGEPETSSKMFEQALLIGFILWSEKIQKFGSRVDKTLLISELREVVAWICDCVKESLQRGAVEDAKAMYNSLIGKLRHKGESGSWIIEYCLEHIGKYLSKFPE